MAANTPLTWSVVIPVKVLAQAKTRLGELADADRLALALAMAADTVAATVGCPLVGAVVVVTDDGAVATEAAALGAEVIAEGPAAGLNEALRTGAAHAADRWPGYGRAALLADLPALRATELAAALQAASAVTHAFVADAEGTGTTLYTARAGASFSPRFGVASRALHLQAGVTELKLPAIAGLRQDVDTVADLRAAAAIGLGRRAAALMMSDRV
jgi:2-phospho-L-lactate/phosphoenolpyruvate guanylyltransferase